MTTLEKEEIKSVIREVVREDKTFFKELLQEILIEASQESEVPSIEADRTKKIDAIIKRDFERYKSVFKALA